MEQIQAHLMEIRDNFESHNENGVLQEAINKLNARICVNNIKRSNLDWDEEQIRTAVVITEELFKAGFELEFIAGVVGNIESEGGNFGIFESSNYNRHPEKEPQYLKHMKECHQYKEESGQNITEIGLDKLNELVNGCTDANHKFGFGCVQWTTQNRVQGLLKCYNEVCKDDCYPTIEQCAEAESKFVAYELTNENSSYGYIYESWESISGDEVSNFEKVANASKLICMRYEAPRDYDTNGVQEKRENYSMEFYEAAIGSN